MKTAKYAAIAGITLMLSGCRENIDKDVLELKTEFQKICENKFDETGLNDGRIDGIIQRRNKFLNDNWYSLESEEWYCRNIGGSYMAIFPETNFPNPS